MLSKEILDKYKPWLVSVARTGSTVLPWINDSRDTDYVFYVTDIRDVKKRLAIQKKRPHNECWLIDEFGSQDMRIYAYEYHFLKPVYGEEFPTYDVLEHIPEYKELLVDYALDCEYNPMRKCWYHVLTGVYLIQNNSYELTEEQASNVRLCHSRQMTQEIYDYIQATLREWKAEMEQ
jgi:hypothetical protein